VCYVIEHQFDNLSGLQRDYLSSPFGLGTCRTSSERFAVSVVLSEPVADVVATVDKLRVDDRLITDPEMRLADAEALIDAISGLQAVLLRRVRDAHYDPATPALTGRSTRNWLHEEQLLPGPEASRLMRLVKHLPLHPLTEAAFNDKLINSTHATAILTALNALPIKLCETVEPHLIERARFYPPEEIGGFVDELLQGLGVDKNGDIRRERRHNSRGVDVAETLHGNRSLSGSLTPEVGARFQSALDAASQPAGPEDDRTPRQRRHDALGVIADTFLAQDGPTFSGTPRTVIVTMDLETLEARLREAWISTPWGAISPETARRLACDAELIPVVLGGKSEVLDIGVADHEFTTAQRRAAYLRDGGKCVFPRCGNKCVELHHIKFRRRHGPTSLDNAAWLCAYHHWLVHEGGWTLERLSDGSYLWTSPLGVERIRKRETA
jgi:hypothetical protein